MHSTKWLFHSLNRVYYSLHQTCSYKTETDFLNIFLKGLNIFQASEITASELRIRNTNFLFQLYSVDKARTRIYFLEAFLFIYINDTNGAKDI